MNKQIKEFVDYFYKLAKKQKIVFVSDVQHDPKTPTPILHQLLMGNASGKLGHMYAYRKGLLRDTTKLGSLRKNSIIVFLEENQGYVEKKEKEWIKLKRQHDQTKKKLEKIEQKIAKNI